MSTAQWPTFEQVASCAKSSDGAIKSLPTSRELICGAAAPLRKRASSRAGTCSDKDAVCVEKQQFDPLVQEVERLQTELWQEFDALGESHGASDSAVDLKVARAALTRARAETANLWKVIQGTIPNPVLVELQHRDALTRAEAELEFETQQRAELHAALRESVDQRTFAVVMRRLEGIDDDSSVSVGLARSIFEADSDKVLSRGPSQTRLVGRGRDASHDRIFTRSHASREPCTREVGTRECARLPPRSNSRAGPSRQDAERTRRCFANGIKPLETKEDAGRDGATTREASVRDRIRALQGVVDP
mmetsp:Transcript_46227/g.122545  ORF Transcript_46227/g.122545 Transcript_46227/m.122545 type:complete len:305 (-) Transcript_46227:263-1177(-)